MHDESYFDDFFKISFFVQEKRLGFNSNRNKSFFVLTRLTEVASFSKLSLISMFVRIASQLHQEYLTCYTYNMCIIKMK